MSNNFTFHFISSTSIDERQQHGYGESEMHQQSTQMDNNKYKHIFELNEFTIGFVLSLIPVELYTLSHDPDKIYHRKSRTNSLPLYSIMRVLYM